MNHFRLGRWGQDPGPALRRTLGLRTQVLPLFESVGNLPLHLKASLVFLSGLSCSLWFNPAVVMAELECRCWEVGGGGSAVPPLPWHCLLCLWEQIPWPFDLRGPGRDPEEEAGMGVSHLSGRR